ncbi:unnamed protein product, partial [Rotaria sp. Silwood2]
SNHIQHHIGDQQPRPQFPHNDYIGIVNDLEKEIYFKKSSKNLNDIVISTQYRINEPDKLIINKINSICEEENNGKFIGGVVFGSLHESKWKFER